MGRQWITPIMRQEKIIPPSVSESDSRTEGVLLLYSVTEGRNSEKVYELSSMHVGCRVDNVNVNNISYGDDMVLLSPSISGLRKMIKAFVVLGVSLNMSSLGSVMGFTAILLPQLRAPDSGIKIDGSSASWIASIVGISLLIGNFLVPTIMGKFGRRFASLMSSFIILASWLWISVASDVTSILIARFFQGFSLGINLSLNPIMVGELTSPRNRGIFSSLLATSITVGTLFVHIIGSYLSWEITAFFCAFINFTSFTILLLSPESPSWLADKGRFEDSKKAYHWLRGYEEDDELESMLEARKARDIKNIENETETNNKIGYFISIFSKKEFYKPVIIMVHLYTIHLWTGMCFLIVFTVDIIKLLVGNDVDVAMHLTILDIQRTIVTFGAVYVVKTVRRRKILFSTVGANFVILVVIALYSLGKDNGVLPFDHPAIGLLLLHLHMCALTTGALPLPVMISGELFPLEFRSLAGGISSLSFSVNYFVTSKTAMYLLSVIGIHGTYLLYAAVTFYCLVVVWVLLPETKDRTLQDIDDEFSGKLEQHNLLSEYEKEPLKV